MTPFINILYETFADPIGGLNFEDPDYQKLEATLKESFTKEQRVLLLRMKDRLSLLCDHKCRESFAVGASVGLQFREACGEIPLKQHWPAPPSGEESGATGHY